MNDAFFSSEVVQCIMLVRLFERRSDVIVGYFNVTSGGQISYRNFNKDVFGVYFDIRERDLINTKHKGWPLGWKCIHWGVN
jgi:hypothetical protein